MYSNFTGEQLSKICGNLIYNERKSKRKSAKIIAELSGISQQYLSEIELGTRNVTPTAMSNICDTLDIDFSYDMDYINDADILFKKCLRYVADYNYSKLLNALNDLQTDKYRYSYAYSYYQCAHIIHRLYIDKEVFTAPISLKRLEVNTFLKSFVYFINSVIMDDLSEVNEGLSIFNDAEYRCETITLLLLNQKACLLEKKHDYESALYCNEKAKSISHSLYLTTGALSIEMNIANIFSRLGKYQDSNMIYLRIIDISSELNVPDIYCAALFNFAYNKMISGYYTECINTINQLMSEFKNLPAEYSSVYYLLAYSYFMCGEVSKASVYCSEAFESLSREDFQYKITYLINLCINNSINDAETDIAIEYFNETIQNGDLGDIIIIYHLLTEALKSNNEFTSAFRCSEKFISYLTDRIKS